MGQETRNNLTDYWKEHEIKEGQEFAILTNIIHQEWSGITVKQHKNILEDRTGQKVISKKNYLKPRKNNPVLDDSKNES